MTTEKNNDSMKSQSILASHATQSLASGETPACKPFYQKAFSKTFQCVKAEMTEV